MRCALSQYRHYPRCVVAATTLCLTGLIVSDASASSTALTAPQPFEAKYRLSVSGWPSATITHHLSKADSHWRSDMRFSIAVVSGEERSRFSVADDSTRALLYNSRYSLFGIGNDYQLRESELTTLDRQTALFDLSRRAGKENCSEEAPCDLRFLDHEGEEEHYQYYVDSQAPISVPAGEFDALNVVMLNTEKSNRELHLSFHPDWPGLVLSAQYIKNGERETQIALTEFNPDGGATP
ncbi:MULTISPECIES: hypothetical protein [unclassified Halomonas]|uniref:hypothetical protein n=1 Tax=unclassified Halomonas TaxID=2609666 RepID=UPI0006D9538D|nr:MULTISPECIES: hypothetical protein [unclassified Halomonas]KPQ23905.1 MAG: hypothetical protein HLUCCO06_10335 [Halomonas sp. HL-93]SBR46630.1 hypothetical protein GA0071314_0819 [Halomonas sp. HL-93]SNY98839.1 hypothetical protein SAMN04488142_3472 [Halomonas sp. hl-4]